MSLMVLELGDTRARDSVVMGRAWGGPPRGSMITHDRPSATDLENGASVRQARRSGEWLARGAAQRKLSREAAMMGLSIALIVGLLGIAWIRAAGSTSRLAASVLDHVFAACQEH